MTGGQLHTLGLGSTGWPHYDDPRIHVVGASKRGEGSLDDRFITWPNSTDFSHISPFPTCSFFFPRFLSLPFNHASLTAGQTLGTETRGGGEGRHLAVSRRVQGGGIGISRGCPSAERVPIAGNTTSGREQKRAPLGPLSRQTFAPPSSRIRQKGARQKTLFHLDDKPGFPFHSRS